MVTNQFQSTPSAWRETAAYLYMDKGGREFQSTPSAWRETLFAYVVKHFYAISIHSLRMEGDRQCAEWTAGQGKFQSTPSAWRETGLWRKRSNFPTHFNPLPPHGGRQATIDGVHLCSTFQSTPSAWRETYQVLVFFCRQFHFNPLPPHGGRLPSSSQP